MAEPAWLTFLIDLVTDEGKHFALSAFMGVLAFLLMWIILSAGVWVVERLTHRKASMAVDYGMAICSLLLGLSAALASHWLLDYAALWYITPLGPGLDLVY